MNPAAITPSTLYTNPFFLAAFGIVTALGAVLFALAYFVFVKLKVMNNNGKDEKAPSGDQAVGGRGAGPGKNCLTCGFTMENLAQFIPCKHHGEFGARLQHLEEQRKEQSDDLKELRRRVDQLEREE